jgi:predicted PolB exonuclease-like 3'-5' exonuclease
MTETLQKIEVNRDENLKLLKQKKSLIIKQISAAKSKVLKYLDEIEDRLITEVESAQEKNEEKINSFNVDILNFFKLHVYFINSRRHVMNLLVCFLDDCYLFS